MTEWAHVLRGRASRLWTRARDLTVRDVARGTRNKITKSASRRAASARRVVAHSGRERDTVFLVIKSAGAAIIAWGLATWVLGAPVATFAPFSALLTVQVTVYRTLLQSLRYVLAVEAGIVLAGAVSPTLGQHLWTFGLLVLIALVIGQWHRLGTQGIQVPVAALFAYAMSGPGEQGTLLWLVILVLLGAAVGVVTNMTVMPPTRARSAANGVAELATAVKELLTDMASGLREGVPDEANCPQSWLRRARELDQTLTKARATVERGAESAQFNPRRLLNGTPATFADYRNAVNTLGRAGEQLRQISKGLSYAAADEERQDVPHDEFLRVYGNLLDITANAAGDFAPPDSTDGVQRQRQLDEHVRQSQQRYQELTDYAKRIELDAPDQWPTYGSLLTDAQRLVEELTEGQRDTSTRM